MWAKKDLPDGDWPILFGKGRFADGGCSGGAEELSNGEFHEVPKSPEVPRTNDRKQRSEAIIANRLHLWERE